MYAPEEKKEKEKYQIPCSSDKRGSFSIPLKQGKISHVPLSHIFFRVPN